MVNQMNSPFMYTIRSFIPYFFFSHKFHLFIDSLKEQIFLFVIIQFTLSSTSFTFQIMIFRTVLHNDFLRFIKYLIRNCNIFKNSIYRKIYSSK